MFTNKPDFMIGNSYGKFIQRDTLAKGKAFEVPLIRLGFPIFDRHHLHRMTTLGYEGAMYMLTTLVNAVMEKLIATPWNWAKQITTSIWFVNRARNQGNWFAPSKPGTVLQRSGLICFNHKKFNRLQGKVVACLTLCSVNTTMGCTAT